MTDIAETQPVDPPEPASHRERPETPAVLPDWLSSWASLVDQAKWSTRHGAHVTAFHLLRLPVYWLRLIAHAPRGLWRVLHRLAVWAKDAPGATMSVTLVQSGESKGPEAGNFLKVRKDHHNAVASRITTLLILVAGTGVAVYLIPWTHLLIAANVFAALTVLGAIGKPADRRVTSRSVDTEKVPRMTADLIIEALSSLGIAELNKAISKQGAKAIRFTSPITRDGPGFRADVDLPGGVTAEQVIAQRARLASGLRRPISCVWPEGDSEAHAGWLILWVGDKPLNASRPAAWPLAGKGGKVDLFEPFPIGVDPRGKPVTIVLVFASMIVGALPRMGKTFMTRLVLLAAALDPTAQLHIYDLKGGADFLPLEPVAHRFRIGDDPEDVDYLLADLRELKDDLTRRFKVLRSLPRDICPEGKVTRDLANRRDLGLFPIVLAVDECQRAFEHDTHGREMEVIVTDLAKRGPAAGIIVICSTQRPDQKSLPSGISTNAVLRFCLKVMRHQENDMVLGTGMHSSGITATMFQRSDRGIGYLVGEGDDPVITRVYYVDGPGAESVAKRAREERQKAGLLTGHAIGQETPQDETPQDSVYEHLDMVFHPDEDKLWSDVLADRLATTYPSIYAGWDGSQLSSAVSKDMTTRQINRMVDGRQVNKRGFYRSDLTRAIERRRREADRLAAGPSTPQDSAPSPALGLATVLGGVLGGSEHENTPI